MKKRKAFAATFATTAAVVASVTVAPTAALAVYRCAEKYVEVCFYENFGWTGSTMAFRTVDAGASFADFRWYQYTNGKNLNDSASSVWNGSNHTIGVFEHGFAAGSGGGRITFVPAHSGVDFTGGGDKIPNDSASAFVVFYD
ncbi:peptidase inhibitor family I36 protein [Micromonospora sp. NPDC051543]|uniref:peptidase inhibitor family I36 protein n=1 Tax=Micromonospora sp. NPDC051543 TaxID=3364287 RepID=UPI0037AF9E75